MEVNGRGTLFAFTILREPFHPGFVGAVPVIIGLTELGDASGVRILTNIVEADREGLRCGPPMEVVFETRRVYAAVSAAPRLGPVAGAAVASLHKSRDFELSTTTDAILRRS